MFAVSLKEVDFPVEKQNLYVRNNLSVGDFKGSDGLSYIRTDYLSYVGECLINMDDHTIYKIGKKIKYTRTQDLIEQVLTEYGKFDTHIIYYSKDKSAVCINLILRDYTSASPAEYRFALEISNYYSGRYSPKITLSLYNIHRDSMIRTPISAFIEKGALNLNGIEELHTVLRSKSLIYNSPKIIYLLPKKIRDTAIFYGARTCIDVLDVIAGITDKWLETNYELATMTQRKIYTILTNKQKE